MKKYMINVNGNSYEVEVEEIGGAAAAPRAAAAAAPVAPAAAPTAAAPATPKAAAPAPQGAENIIAPMPGKVTTIKVKAGQTVKAGELILYLEAMKMENEIYCNKGGKVVDIRVNPGDSVNANDIMVVLG